MIGRSFRLEAMLEWEAVEGISRECAGPWMARRRSRKAKRKGSSKGVVCRQAIVMNRAVDGMLRVK